MKTFTRNSARPSRGFTLMESVIAIGVVAVLLTTFLAVFGPATQSIRRVLSTQDADRLQTALVKELSLLRVGPDDDYDSAFAKAFEWIRDSGNTETAVLLYNYRGDPKDVRKDGTLQAFGSDDGQAGKDFILQPGVRRKGDSDTDMEDDLERVEGQVFYVRLTQMVRDPKDGSLIPGENGKIVNEHSSDEVFQTSAKYPGATIAFSADFYALKSNNIDYIKALDLTDDNGDGNPDSLGKPLFSSNLGVRR